MGNLFTRALKRFTQCSSTSSRNQLPSEAQQDAGTSQQQEQQSRPIAQSIPVGQSIDSAEYAAFESAKSSRAGLEKEAGEQESRLAAVRATIEEEDETKADQENGPPSAGLADEQSKPEVEEAVIKIQAFVRGHLTRKALKDAQQHAATPPPNALGQSQFDQESLMKSPPSAVFAMSAPPADSPGDQMSRLGGSSRLVPPLESIAEDVESGGQPAGSSDQAEQRQRRKLAPISRALAISGEGRSDSVSPVPSETNASIELNCGTPASASIDILDHNIRPADALASVLHPKPAPEAESDTQASREARASPRMLVVEPPEPAARHSDNGTHPNSQAGQQTLHQSSTTPAVQNSHSIDSAEAAAIRIQSAYRGYHTRKNSPYRRRSPAGGLASSSPPSLDGGLSNGQAARRSPLRQQNATVALEDLIDEEQRLARLQEAPTRRASRSRRRLDTDDSQQSDSAATQGSALEAPSTSNTLDEHSNETCVSMVAMDSADAATANLSHQAARLTEADDSSVAASAHPSNEQLKLSIDRNPSLEMDTESSNLGAALSMSEDISERDAAASIRQQPPSPDERAFEAQRLVDQLVNDEEEDEAEAEQEEELERVSGQLEAALEQATEDEGLDQVAESLASAILDEDEQRTIELESDDIERRDPRGQRGQDRANSPAISAQDSQPALVSAGSFEDEQQQQQQQQELTAEQQEQRHESSQDQQPQRLPVDSPDEAIGSGRSSPALVSSNAGSSEDEDENEEEAETQAATGQTDDKQGQPQQVAPAGNKNKKKNRNRKKGRK